MEILKTITWKLSPGRYWKGALECHTSQGKGFVGNLAFYWHVVLSTGSFCKIQTQSVACIRPFDMPIKVSSMLSALSVVALESFISTSYDFSTRHLRCSDRICLCSGKRLNMQWLTFVRKKTSLLEKKNFEFQYISSFWNNLTEFIKPFATTVFGLNNGALQFYVFSDTIVALEKELFLKL